MENRFAFFDVDCYEKCDAGFTFRPRVKPIGNRVEKLHALAEERGVRLVFTTCCDGRMLKPGEDDEILFVPVESEKTDWLNKLDASRIIYLHKLAWGSVKGDIEHVAWDMFLHNKNASRLIQTLNIPQWYVFGNGMDLCVSSAAKGILAAGSGVTLISDVMISSANGTKESMEKTIVDLCAMGAKRTTYDEFFEAMK